MITIIVTFLDENDKIIYQNMPSARHLRKFFKELDCKSGILLSDNLWIPMHRVLSIRQVKP